MNIFIFTFGLLFVTLEAAPAKTAKEVNDQINAIKNEIATTLRKADSVKTTELAYLSQQILRITQSNELIIQTKQELQNYGLKGQDCQVLFTANYYSIVDQLYVKANDSITNKLSDIEKSLKTITLKLNALKKQVDDWDNVLPENKDKVVKEVNRYSQIVDKSGKDVATLVQSILDNIEKNLFPNSARENVYKPVTECLNKIKSP